MSCLSVFSFHTCSPRDIANNRLSGNSPYSLLGKFVPHTSRTSSWVRQHSLHPPWIKMICKINIHLTPRTHLRICIQQRKISLTINCRCTKCSFKSWHKSGFSLCYLFPFVTVAVQPHHLSAVFLTLHASCNYHLAHMGQNSSSHQINTWRKKQHDPLCSKEPSPSVRDSCVEPLLLHCCYPCLAFPHHLLNNTVFIYLQCFEIVLMPVLRQKWLHLDWV